MKHGFTIAVLAMLVLHINKNATATPIPGVHNPTSAGGCYIAEYSSSLLSSAVNYSQIVKTNCASFKTYRVHDVHSGNSFYIAECATCKSGFYENGYGVSTTDGLPNGRVVVTGPDWKTYTYSACGGIAFQASCSARTTCSPKQITMETTTISYCNAEKTVVFGNSAWRSCSDCQGGNAGTQGQSVYAPSGGPCSNYYYTVSINTCKTPCSDSNCGSQTTDWKCGEYANGTASDAACWRTKYYCLSDGYTCTSSKENKCVSGYYMSGSTCATCPAGSDGNAAQSIDAATSINDCYVTSGRDPSGTYLFVNGASTYMCNYSE